MRLALALSLFLGAACGGGHRRAGAPRNQEGAVATEPFPTAPETTVASGPQPSVEEGLPAAPPSGVGGQGLPPVVRSIVTDDPVVFVTIDDGWDKDPTVLPFLADHHIAVTAFLIGRVAVRTAPYWDTLLAQGGVVEDHTETHPTLAGHPLAFQRTEICSPLDDYQRLFGRRPTLFRPPYGSLDHTTVVAARDCGLSDVVLWDATVSRGKLRRATPGPLRRGDVILLHWGPGLAGDLKALVAVLDSSGFQTALLEDYLRPGAAPAAPPVGSEATTAPPRSA